MSHISLLVVGLILPAVTYESMDGFEASLPLIASYNVTITTKPIAAPNRLILTQWSSAISFMKHVGNNNTAIKIP